MLGREQDREDDDASSGAVLADLGFGARRPRDLFNAAILDALPDAVALVDAEGVVRSVNLAWVRHELDFDLPAPGDPFEDDHVRAVIRRETRGTTYGRAVGTRWLEVRVAALDVEGQRWAIVIQDDVTALRDALGLWESSFTAAAVPMAWVDKELRVLDANPALAALFDRPLSAIVGGKLTDHLDAEGVTLAIRRRDDALAGHPGDRVGETDILRPDGTRRTVQVHLALVSPGNRRGAVVQLMDVTAQRAAEDRLALHRELLELVAAGTPVDAVALAVAVNIGRAVPNATGAVLLRDGAPVWAPDLESAWLPFVGSLDGRPVTATPYGTAWSEPIPSAGLDSPGAVVVLRRGSAPVTADDEAAAALLASVLRLAIQRDEAASAVAVAALHDQSSGLPTTVLFVERLGRAIDRLVSRRTALGVLALGVDEGDLATVAQLVADELPPQHELARRGGHLIASVELTSSDDLVELVRRIHRRAGGTVRIGAALAHHGASPETVLRNAETALLSARRSSRCWAMHDAPDEDRVAVEDLRAALDHGDIDVHYQPIIDLRDGGIVGLEALVRWQHPDHGAIPPPTIIELAESGGALDEVSGLVLARACRDLATWRASAPHLTMAVNLSGSQLSGPDLVASVTGALATAGVPPSALVVEITESVVVDDIDVAASALAQLRDIGVRVAIDDFGTGYSSLLYLKRFPADVLKVDRAFVQGLGVNDGDTAIVDAVVGLGHRLGLEVVAEGVETEDQLDELRRRRCDQAQGFLLRRPAPASELDEVLARGCVTLGPQPAAPARKDLDVDELLAAVTHELSTPLTILSGHAELLAESLTGDPQVAEAIERNVRNIDDLLRSLAGVTRAATPSEPSVTVDLGRLVEQTVEDLAPLHSQHAVTVHVPAGTHAELDPVATRQILTNLVGNAVKFTPAGTAIEVTVRTLDRVHELRVTDHGPGVDPAREHELFGRFSRLGATARGLGLGLHLSRELARRQGGDLVHEPTPGGGATFVATFPA